MIEPEDLESEEDELTDEERRMFEELEQQMQTFYRYVWNHGEGKNHGVLQLRWGEDGEVDIDMDKRAVMRVLHFLCDEQARRLHDLEHDC